MIENAPLKMSLGITCRCGAVYEVRHEFGNTVTTRVHAERCGIARFIASHDTTPPGFVPASPDDRELKPKRVLR